MATTILNTPGTFTWSVPSWLIAGNTIGVVAVGGGSGGATTSTTYTLTPNNISNGIPYTVGLGSAGGNTNFSNNNLNAHRNSIFAGAIVGSPGTMPTNCSITAGGGLTRTVVGFGIDVGSGFPYFDLQLTGTTVTNTAVNIVVESAAVATASVAWMNSLYWALVSGSWPSSSLFLTIDYSNSGTGYLSTSASSAQSAATSTLTRITQAVTTPANTDRVNLYMSISYSIGVVFNNLILRFAAPQIELGGSTSAFKSTPGYALATGSGTGSDGSITLTYANNPTGLLQPQGVNPASFRQFIM